MDNDLISRQAAIDVIKHNQEIYSNNFGGDAIDKYTVAIIANDIEALINLPSAERHGRWEDIEHAPNGLLYATCSVCGKRQTVEATNYCGNCGARMVEE